MSCQDTGYFSSSIHTISSPYLHFSSYHPTVMFLYNLLMSFFLISSHPSLLPPSPQTSTASPQTPIPLPLPPSLLYHLQLPQFSNSPIPQFPNSSVPNSLLPNSPLLTPQSIDEAPTFPIFSISAALHITHITSHRNTKLHLLSRLD